MTKPDAQQVEATITACEGLIQKIARRHIRPGVEMDDLMQEGRLALVRAIETYDAERGVRFETWAWPLVENAIERGVWRELRQIALPHREYRMLQRLRAIKSRLSQDLMREPTTEEIALSLEVSESHVTDLLILGQEPICLDEKPIVHDSSLWADKCLTNSLESREQAERLQIAMTALSPRQQVVVNRHLLQEDTFKEIGSELGISAPRVCQIKREAVQKLKKVLDS